MQNSLWVFATNHLDSNDNQVPTKNLNNSYKNTTNEHITEPNEYKAWFRWFLCQPTRKWISLHSIRGGSISSRFTSNVILPNTSED